MISTREEAMPVEVAVEARFVGERENWLLGSSNC